MPKTTSKPIVTRIVNGTPIEESSGNVFADLGLPDADELLAKAPLIAAIAGDVRRRGLTQARAASLIGLKQSELSRLMRGNAAGFSSDRLIEALRHLGFDVEITLRPGAASGLGRFAVHELAAAS